MINFYWFIEYMSGGIELIMCCIFCGTFLIKDKLSDKRNPIIIFALFGAYIICVLNNYKLFSYINSLIVILVCILFQWILYKKHIGSIIGLVLLYCVILSAIDFSTAQMASLLLRTETTYLLNEQSITRVICTLLSKSILILIIMVINKIVRNSKILSKKHIIVMCICSMLILTSNFAMIRTNAISEEKEIAAFSIIFFIVSLFLELLLLYLMFKITENYEQKQTLTLIEMKNEMLQKSQNDTELAFKLWRNSIHDYKNNIIALTQLAKEGKLEEIKEYLIKENQLLNQKMFYVKTGNSVVDAIINTKQNLAEQKGIVFTVNVSIPEECKVNDIDMASMLGNLIDNAIEACSNQNNSYIDVTIKEEKQILLIKISNIYKGILPEQMQSTKKDRLFHGIGIKSVKSIVEKYNGEYNMIHRDNEVVTTILILNK